VWKKTIFLHYAFTGLTGDVFNLPILVPKGFIINLEGCGCYSKTSPFRVVAIVDQVIHTAHSLYALYKAFLSG